MRQNEDSIIWLNLQLMQIWMELWTVVFI